MFSKQTFKTATCRIEIEKPEHQKIVTAMQTDVMDLVNCRFNKRTNKTCEAFIHCYIDISTGCSLVGDIHTLHDHPCKPFQIHKIKQKLYGYMHRSVKDVIEYYEPHYLKVFKKKHVCANCKSSFTLPDVFWKYSYRDGNLYVDRIECPICGMVRKLGFTFTEERYKSIAAFYPKIANMI